MVAMVSNPLKPEGWKQLSASALQPAGISIMPIFAHFSLKMYCCSHCTWWSGRAAWSWRAWSSAALGSCWTGREWWCRPPGDPRWHLFPRSLKRKRRVCGNCEPLKRNRHEQYCENNFSPARDSSYFRMCSTRLSTSWTQAFFAGLYEACSSDFRS